LPGCGSGACGCEDAHCNRCGEAEPADAKQKICAATNLVRRGVSLNTNLQPAGGPGDVTGTLANILMDIGAAATAGASNSQPEQATRLHDADAANGTITELCK
jgi:hypothetical protein